MSQDGERTRHPRLASLLAVLCVLTLIGLVVTVVMLRPRTTEVRERESNEAAVVQAAQRFTVTWNTIDPEDPDEYVESVTPLLSTKFRKEFTDTKVDVVTSIRQLGLSSTGRVLNDKDGIPLVGVASLDNDSATAFVVSDSRRVSGGQPVIRHWRWQLDMVRVDDRWLVDDLEAVG